MLSKQFFIYTKYQPTCGLIYIINVFFLASNAAAIQTDMSCLLVAICLLPQFVSTINFMFWC